MHGLPRGFDGGFLVGRTLELVCFSSNTVNLRFDDEVSISIEGKFSYRRQGASSNPKVVEVPVAESDLMRLVAHTVTEVLLPGGGTLSLVFDNGDVMECLDTPRYESYHIWHGTLEIIV